MQHYFAKILFLIIITHLSSYLSHVSWRVKKKPHLKPVFQSTQASWNAQNPFKYSKRFSFGDKCKIRRPTLIITASNWTIH